MSQTSALREALDDLSAETAPMSSERLAAGAWRTGRRRRGRRRLGQVLAAAVALGVVVLVLPTARQSLPTGAGDSAEVATYPQRINDPWFVGELPDRSDPVAGLMALVEGDFAPWYAVTSAGVAGWVPGYVVPIPSPDGRYLLTVGTDKLPSAATTDRLVLRDLVAGTRRAFPSIVGDQQLGEDPEVRYAVDQSRSWPGAGWVHWSPDSSLALLQAMVRRDTGWSEQPAPYLLDVASGELLPAPRPARSSRGRTQPIGFADPGSLAYLVWRPGHTDSADLATIDLATGAQQSVPLTGLGWEIGDPREVSLSPDGTTLAAVDSLGGGRARFRLFNTSTGRQTDVRDAIAMQSGNPLAWSQNDPVYTTGTRDVDGLLHDVRPVAARADGLDPLVAVDPGLKAQRLIWAAGALSGSPQPSWLGLRDAWWTWHPWWLTGPLVALFGWGLVRGPAKRRRAARSDG